MKELLKGVHKYSNEVFEGQKPLFDTLSKGQSPHTLFITCSDSRIDPCLITQTKPGDLFVIRNAGNLVPAFGASNGGEEPTIEYAVDGLKVRNIVVCGHSKCGAMGALLDKPSVDSLPSVRKWLDHAESTLRSLPSGTSDVQTAVQNNVRAQIANLKTHPSVAAATDAGRLNLYAWVYHFEKGSVSAYNAKSNKFAPLVEVGADEDLSGFCL